MNVVVITENSFYDQELLRPVVEAMFNYLEKPGANIRFYQNEARMKGVAAVMDWEKIKKVLNRYKSYNIILLLVDRDGIQKRETDLQTLRQQAIDKMNMRTFIPECARQEIEVWVLAGCDDLEWNITVIRDEPNPKETYFLPYSKKRGYFDRDYNGHKYIATQSAQNYKRIRHHCPELQTLEEKIQAVLTQSP